MTKIEELLKNEKVEWKKLGEVFRRLQGTTITATEMKKINRLGGDIRVFAGGKTVVDTFESLIEKPNIIRVPSVLVQSRGNIDVVYYEKPFTFKNEMWAYTTDNKIMVKYLYYFLQNDIQKFRDKALAKGSFPQISIDDTDKYLIPIPSLEIQEKIVKTLDKFQNYVTELNAELNARTCQYHYYRDMLLSEEYLKKVSEKVDKEIVQIAKLKNVCKIIRGKRLVRSELEKSGKYPVFQNSVKPLGYYKEKNFQGDKTFIISAGAAGDIVYQEEDFWAADDVFVLDASEEIINKFLYYFLMKKQFIIKSKVRKASIPRLSREEIEKIEIHYPSKKIQKDIVRILDRFHALLSETTGLLPQEIKQRQKQYEFYREKLLTYTHTHTIVSDDFLALIKEAADIVGVSLSEKVEWKTLAEVTLEVDNIKWSEYDKEKVKYIDLSSVDRIFHSISGIQYIDKENAPSRAKQVVCENDILFGTTRPLLQRFCMVPKEWKNQICSTGFCVLRANEQVVLPKWIYYFVSSTYFYRKIEYMQTGTSYPTVSDKDVKSVKIPLPSLTVQKYIVNILDKFDALVNDLTKGLPKEIELREKEYIYYREKLLAFPKDLEE
ncbi:MAG: restriction endonuclease subunit S [Eubacteriales bacterium]|nr:restriction endonuclease subunit S [Eubacteriales bacterium]